MLVLESVMNTKNSLLIYSSYGGQSLNNFVSKNISEKIYIYSASLMVLSTTKIESSAHQICSF